MTPQAVVKHDENNANANHIKRSRRGSIESADRFIGQNGRPEGEFHLHSQNAGDWMLVHMAVESEATLNNQERGKDWEYRVIATNKAGESTPSNTVAAVL